MEALHDPVTPFAWLDGLIDIERSPRAAAHRLSLDPVCGLLDRIGHPERGLSVVHVAGSKGKGSTALLAEAVLLEAGERVGTFVSPHLERWTERFRIGGQEVRPAALGRVLDAIRPHVDALRADPDTPDPSFFDTITAAALLLFHDARVDRAVVEVGLGGRLDSTNVVDAAVSCITSIELEHTDRLGSTLAEIAAEKAGIIKAGRPVVTGRLPDEAAAVVAERARTLGAPVSVLGRDFHVEILAERPLRGVDLRLQDGSVAISASLPVAGRHQAENAAVAVAAIRRLGAHEEPALTAAAGRALAKAVLPGRIEVLGERPWIVVDAAHTERSASVLAAVISGVSRRRTRLLLSVSAGKRLGAILAQLLPLADDVVATRAEPVRSLGSGELAHAVRSAAPGLPVRVIDDPAEAARAALHGLTDRDLLLVTGSVYLAGIARGVLGTAPRTRG